jgi:hypothetical protein
MTDDTTWQIQASFQFHHPEQVVTISFDRVPFDAVEDLFDQIGTEKGQRSLIDGLTAAIEARRAKVDD